MKVQHRVQKDDDTSLKMNYGYSNLTPLYAGSKLLTSGGVNAFAIDNPGNSGPIGIYDGFSKAEKYYAIKNNRRR